MYKLITLFFLGCIVSLNAQKSALRFAKIDLTAAKQRAAIEDKLIFIDTYASYCRACKTLELEFNNPKLAKFFNKHFINVRIDMDTEAGKEIKNKYEVVFLPTILIIDQLGNQRYKLDQLIGSEELLSIAKFYQEKYYPGSTPVSRATLASTKKTKTKAKATIAKPTVKKTTTPPTEPASTIAQKKETTNGSKKAEEKILYVLGQGGDNLPPEILKQEAYFKMQFMDGSHHQAAKKYLSTQDDWSSEENIRFIFDFLYNVNSPEFEFTINNRELFNQTIGESLVTETINILVTKELDRGFPRPNLEMAEKLYTYTDLKDPKNLAAEYNLENLYEEGNFTEFITLGTNYLEANPSCQNASLINKISIQMSKNAGNKRQLKECLVLSDQVLLLEPDNPNYMLDHATLLYKLGNKKEAWSSAQLALQKAKDNNTPTEKFELLLKSISEL